MNALLRLAAWMLAIVLVVLPVVAVLNGWIGADRWPMRRLVVSGAFAQVSDAQVRNAVLPQVGRGFFAVDPAAVRDAVARLPWVDSVTVRKRWPDRLDVVLTEHRPVAWWGDERMLAESGQLFDAPEAARALTLPKFIGPDERAGELAAFYRQALAQFHGQRPIIVSVQLSARGGWSLLLDDGLQVEIGRTDAEQRLARFASLLPKIQSDSARLLQRADLRYTNGFALTWQDLPVQPEPSPNPQGQKSS